MKKGPVTYRAKAGSAFVSGFVRGMGAMGYYLYGEPNIDVRPGTNADDWKAIGDDLRWAMKQHERKSA